MQLRVASFAGDRECVGLSTGADERVPSTLKAEFDSQHYVALLGPIYPKTHMPHFVHPGYTLKSETTKGGFIVKFASRSHNFAPQNPASKKKTLVASSF